MLYTNNYVSTQTLTVNFTIKSIDIAITDDIFKTLFIGFTGFQTLILYNTSDITITTTSCKSGTYSLGQATACTSCIPGTYSSTITATSSATCLLCSAGTYSSSSEANSSSYCFACTSGTYLSNTGASSETNCLSCPEYSSSYIGSTLLSDCVCNPGYTGSNGGLCTGCNASSWCLHGQINPCPPHSISPGLSYDLSQCICKPGYYGDTSLPLTLCQFCKQDHFCPGGGVNLSTICPNGKYSQPGSDEESDCRCPDFASSIIKSKNVSSCQCNPGYYQVYTSSFQMTGGWVCHQCLPDDYCYNGTNFSCPDHSTSLFASDEITDCMCIPGYRNVNGICHGCPVNSYCTGGNTIESCTLHAVSPSQSPDSSRCYCDLGYKGSNNTNCIECNSPHYCYGGIEATCIEGGVSNLLSWSFLNCTCIPGRWGPPGGPCISCGTGKYKTFTGCNHCNAISDEDCEICQAGYYSTVIGRIDPCDACTPGSYSESQASTCLLCPAGTISGPGASTCTSCPLGYISPSNASQCTPCPVGTYLDVSGMDSITDCKICPAGTYSSSIGASLDSTCTPCMAGTYSTNLAATQVCGYPCNHV